MTTTPGPAKNGADAAENADEAGEQTPMPARDPATEEPSGEEAQVWHLDVGARRHEVTSRKAGWSSHEVTWLIDGVLVATKKSSDETMVLGPGDRNGGKGADAAEAESASAPPAPSSEADAEAPGAASAPWADAGAIRVVFSSLGAPRRATWFEGTGATAQAHTGLGGVDLVPSAGSAVAEREAKMAAKPRLYAARHVAGGVGKVVLPILAVWLLAQLAGLLPDFDLPSIPWPDIDLPSIPWPDIDLPSIPWPDFDLPDWELPAWLRWILDNAKYVTPILIGIFLARSEMRRRATQAERRDALAAREAPTSAPQESTRDEDTRRENDAAIAAGDPDGVPDGGPAQEDPPNR